MSGAVPGGTKLFGIVILPKPTVPVSPVTVKNKAADVELSTPKVALDIWELVMFPLIARLTTDPLSVVAGRVANEVVDPSVGVGIGVEVELAVGDAVRIGD